MKDYAEEPKMGPTEHKVPTVIRIKHADLPGIEESALGDRVKVNLEGHVKSQRAKDEFGDGEAEVEVHIMEHQDAPKKENAATMHMDKLKEKLPKKDEEEK